MKSQALKISNELDKAREATHNFISNYVLQMKDPLQHLVSSLVRLEKDPNEQASVDDILTRMESLLNTLVGDLQQSKSRSKLVVFNLTELLLEVLSESVIDVEISMDIENNVMLFTDRRALKFLLTHLIKESVPRKIKNERKILRIQGKADATSYILTFFTKVVRLEKWNAANKLEHSMNPANSGFKTQYIWRLAERMNGENLVKNNEGAVFNITIPGSLS